MFFRLNINGRRWLQLLSMVLLLACASFVQAASVKVGVYSNNPLVFTDEQGQIQGLSIDVLRYVARQEGWELEFVHGTWFECLERLDRGEIDLQVGIAVTPEWQNRYDFSKQLLITNWGRVVISRAADITSMLDLEGKSVAVLKGDIHADIFTEMMKGFDMEFTPLPLSSYDDVLRQVEQKKVDAGIINRLYCMENVNRFRVDKTSIIFQPIEVRYAAPKGKGASLLPVIDHHLQQLRKDKESLYYQSLERWFGGVAGTGALPSWFKIGVIGSAALFALLFLFVILLRQQVRRKTADLREEIAVRKSAEERLSSSENLFRNLIDQATDAILLIDSEGKIVRGNEQACSSLGYSREELLGLTVNDIDPLFVKDKYNQYSKALVSDRQSLIVESVHRRKDGSTFPVEINMGLLEMEGQTLTLALARDVSQRKEFEKELQDAFDIINKSSAVAFLWKNEEGWPVEFVSNNVERLFGYPTSDFLSGRVPYSQVIHPDDLPRVVGEMETLPKNRERKSFRHEPYRIITRDNKTKWIDDQTHIVRDDQGEVIRFQGMVVDVTRRQYAIQALQESEARYAALFTNNHTVILLVDPKSGDIVDANPAACRFYGYSSEELLNMKISAINVIDKEECNALMAEVEVQNSSSFLLKHRLKNGEIRDVEVFTGPMAIEGRTLLCSVIHDVTQRIQLEEEVARSREQLIMGQKMKTIAGLAAGVAHEINTPLSAILQSIQVIQRGFSSEVSGNRSLAEQHGIDLEKLDNYVQEKELDFFLEGIRSSASNAARIVSDLLQFSRPNRGEVQGVIVEELLDSALTLARADYDLKKRYDIINVEISREYDPELPPLYCVPMEIEQVFLNLLKNAVQAMAETSELRKPHITLRTLRKDDRMRIEVEDNGPGMDEEIRGQVFDPFYTTKEVGTGTGLGLSVAYGIVQDKHKGKIWVESAAGNGALFIVELPFEHPVSDSQSE
ncbi:MAG: PAS domain S-box protein [Thermodesulfobacteriota bacterium]